MKMTSTRDAAFLRVVATPGSSSIICVEFILTLSVMLLVSAHPQCLDFEPPFKPLWHLEFCKQYEHFGCCDQKTDNQIAERYWDVIDHLDAEGYEICGDMLKEVMCQVNMFLFPAVVVVYGCCSQ